MWHMNGLTKGIIKYNLFTAHDFQSIDDAKTEFGGKLVCCVLVSNLFSM